MAASTARITYSKQLLFGYGASIYIVYGRTTVIAKADQEEEDDKVSDLRHSNAISDA